MGVWVLLLVVNVSLSLVLVTQLPTSLKWPMLFLMVQELMVSKLLMVMTTVVLVVDCMIHLLQLLVNKLMLKTKLSTHGRNVSNVQLVMHPVSSHTTTIKMLTLVLLHHPIAELFVSVIANWSTSCTINQLITATTQLTHANQVVMPILIAVTGTPSCTPSTTLILNAVDQMVLKTLELAKLQR